jgi:hypothetical protein
MGVPLQSYYIKYNLKNEVLAAENIKVIIFWEFG